MSDPDEQLTLMAKLASTALRTLFTGLWFIGWSLSDVFKPFVGLEAAICIGAC
jgi:hypothetical protein